MSSLDITIYVRPFCVEGWLHVCLASGFFSLEAECHGSAAGLRVDPNRLLKLVAAVDFDAECSEEFVCPFAVALSSCFYSERRTQERTSSRKSEAHELPKSWLLSMPWLSSSPSTRGRRWIPPSHNGHHCLCDSTLWSEYYQLGVKLMIVVC